MTRRHLIEQIIRQVYGGQPTDDADITPNLVNQYINQGIGTVIKQNYKDSIQMDGVSYVNNSFYTSFSGLTISQSSNFLWVLTLPQIPIGIGKNEGISNFKLISNTGTVGIDCIPLSVNQKSYATSMRTIPNRLLYYTEGDKLYILSSLILSQYTGNVTMVSGGSAYNLDSTLNVPDDYIPLIITYVVNALMIERKQPRDLANDGTPN
jgi:hypothetical protein